MRKEFQRALLSIERRDAFDELVEAWSSELGAITYAKSFKLQDLLFLVALVDNRSLINELEKRQTELNETYDKIKEKIETVK